MSIDYTEYILQLLIIRPFWGKDVEDTELVDLLDILKKIVEKDMDVVSGLKYYKEDIISLFLI